MKHIGESMEAPTRFMNRATLTHREPGALACRINLRARFLVPGLLLILLHTTFLHDHVFGIDAKISSCHLFPFRSYSPLPIRNEDRMDFLLKS